MSRIFRITALCLILFSVFTVFYTTPGEDSFAKQADEGYYFMYAKTIKDMGIGQFPILLKHYLSNKVVQLFPHPSRIGHILMTALWFEIFPNTFLSLARFSFFCFILFLIISFFFAKKYFGRDFAYLYTLLLSSNPLIMTSGRRALQDSNVNLFWALSIWFFLDFLIVKKRSKFIIFLLVYSISITVKESSLALLVFFVVAFLIYKYKYNREISNRYLLGIIFIPSFMVGATYIFLLKGFGNVIALLNFVLGAHFTKVVTNSYSLFCSGPWYKYIIDYLLISPLTTLLTIGYFFHQLFIRKFEWKITYFMLFLAIIFAIFSSMKYTKIVRFVMSLDIAISLFTVLAIYNLFNAKENKYKMYCIFIIVICIFFMNYRNFLYLFYQINIYDPVSYWLLGAMRMFPMS